MSKGKKGSKDKARKKDQRVDPADHLVTISVGTSNRGKVQNKHIPVIQFWDRLSKPMRDEQTSLTEYLAYSETADGRAIQADLKSRPGFWIGGPCRGGVRKLSAMTTRHLLALDIDDGTPEQMHYLFNLSELLHYEFFAHISRKHTARKPRWRVVIPLARPVDPEEFNALSRIISSVSCGTVEESMEAVDPVTNRFAQVSYLPSVSRDQDYEFVRNEGELLDPDERLAAFDGDWRDHTQLPYSIREEVKRTSDPNARQQPPREKRGLVGAFCRAYDVEDAIAEFLPHLYAPGDGSGENPRYTYLGGSSANGLVVYDNGDFIHSNHATDPIADQTVNAFDLVRICLFNSRDEGIHGNTTGAALPSYKEMAEFLSGDKRVQTELRADHVDVASMFTDYGDEPVETPKKSKKKKKKKAKKTAEDEPLGFSNLDDDDEPEPPENKLKWLERLELAKEGAVMTTYNNVFEILMNDPRLKGHICYNEMSNQYVRMRQIGGDSMPNQPPIRDKHNGDQWTEHDDLRLRTFFGLLGGKGKKGWGLSKAPKTDIIDAARAVAFEYKFNPLLDRLETLEWDGEPRLDRMFIDHLGCPDTPYHHEVGRLTGLAAVTRIYEPGHKFDTMPVLEGRQGIGKTTFVEFLSLGFTRAIPLGLGSGKERIEATGSAWMLELAELAGMSKSENEQTKEFISSTEDHGRLAYRRDAVTIKRKFILIGTTNSKGYLGDSTGARRFWPMACTAKLDRDLLQAEVPQILAEAVSRYKAMREDQPEGALPLFIADGEAQAEAEALQGSRKSFDESERWTEMMDEHLNMPVIEAEATGEVETMFDDLDETDAPLGIRNRITNTELWDDVLRQRGPIQGAAKVALSEAKGMFGWDECRYRYRGKVTRGIKRPGTTAAWTPLPDDEQEAAKARRNGE